MNIINVVHYLNHLHVIHLSEHIFKARGHGGGGGGGGGGVRISEDALYSSFFMQPA